MILSVIICTFNRNHLLEKCLKSLSHQTSKNFQWEIIVIDNYPQETTKRLVLNYKSKFNHLRYVREKVQGLSFARNKGFTVSRGEYLAYLDDDVILPKQYIDNILQVIKKHKPDFLGGPVYPYYNSKKPLWYKDIYETKKFENKSGFSTSCSITGANYIVKKSILKKIGRFNPDLGMHGKKVGLGEEREILEAYRKRTPVSKQKVFYDLDSFVYHYISPQKLSFSYLIYRHYMGGRVLGKIYKKYDIDPLFSITNHPFSIRLISCILEVINLAIDDIHKEKIPLDIFQIIFISAFRLGLRAEYL